jgi:hypothetical protein
MFTDVVGCEEREEQVQALIEDAKTCKADADCSLFSPGCPFGCVDSMRADSVAKVKEAYRSYTDRCSACVYMCAASLYGRYATCDSGRCAVKEKRRPGLESETARLLGIPDR